MKLVLKSILGGIIGVLIPLLMTIDGSKVNGSFAFAMWLIGFLTPPLYVLDKIYQEIKSKNNN